MHRAIISLGSNISKEENLPAALRLLAEREQVVAVSSVYETVPVGLRDQPNFFNAAVLIETTASPAALKSGVLTDIERHLRRVRRTDKNAPRTIDLDISWYDDGVLQYTAADGVVRSIPDPDLRRFAHVALPVAELLPDTTIHPETGESIQAIAQRLLLDSAIPEGATIWRREDVDLRQHLDSL